jgi:diguanylate cyclase (GGDEF)-like protein
MDSTTMPRRPGAPASRGGAAAVARSQAGFAPDVLRLVEPGPAEACLRRLVEELAARVEEGSLELERTHAEYEIAHAELEAVNAELQKLLLEQEQLQAELAYRALHDPLTGLANRSMFGERLDQAFKVAGRGVAVLWIDLDDFKEVNDIFGHEVGDELLVAIADRLREIVRETDDIARMGGDEFAIVVPNVGRDESELVGQRVLDALLDQDSFRLQIRASIGVSWQNISVGDRKVLLRRADEAMYKAKAAGGGLMVAWCP